MTISLPSPHSTCPVKTGGPLAGTPAPSGTPRYAGASSPAPRGSRAAPCRLLGALDWRNGSAESHQSRSTDLEQKRTIGHDALRLALEHERTCFNDIIRTFYVYTPNPDGASHHSSGRHITIKEHLPSEYERVVQRWDEAREFERWAMEEFRRSYDTSKPTIE